jgi:hypothetical protein
VANGVPPQFVLWFSLPFYFVKMGLFFTLHTNETLFQSHNSWINSSYITSIVNKLKKCLLGISLKRQLVGACPQVREYMKPHQRCRLQWFTLGVFFQYFDIENLGKFFPKIAKFLKFTLETKNFPRTSQLFFVQKKNYFILNIQLVHNEITYIPSIPYPLPIGTLEKLYRVLNFEL